MESLEKIRVVKEKYKEELLSRPGVTGVSLGEKIVKGKTTGVLALLVYVKEKRDVGKGEAIPPSFDGIPTDVIERTYVRLGGSSWSRISGANWGRISSLSWGRVSAEDIQYIASLDLYPHDPLVGGINIGPRVPKPEQHPPGHPIGDPYGKRTFEFGTLGCFVWSQSSQKWFGLTAAHVVKDPWDIGADIVHPSVPFRYAGKCIQELASGSTPTPSDSDLHVPSSEVFATLDSHGLDDDDGIDAALLDIVPGHDYRANGRAGIGQRDGAFSPIPSVLNDMPVRKRGGTSRVTHGTVFNNGQLDLTIEVDGETIAYDGMIEVVANRRLTPVFVEPGDSGSVIVDRSGRVVGLLVLGSLDGAWGAAIPIDRILEKFDVEISGADTWSRVPT